MSNVLITGANSGFGLLTARTFAAAGHNVSAGYRSRARADELFDLSIETPNVRPVELDVTRQDLIDAALVEAQSAGPIDILVNNAGFELACPVDSLSDELLYSQFNTNVFGLVRMVRAVVPGMRTRGKGAVVNLSSVVGWLTLPYAAAYGASKHAVESLSEGLWFELAPFGVRVALVEPGAFPTNLYNSLETASDFDDRSPHWVNAERFRGALHEIVRESHEAANPQEVADLVFEAATTDNPRLRYVAGADARALIPAYRNQEFEPYRDNMLTRLGLEDWGILP